MTKPVKNSHDKSDSTSANSAVLGTWHGTIAFGDVPITVILRLSQHGGELIGSSDFPSHQRFDLPLREARFAAQIFSFTTRSFGDYSGTLSPDGRSIDGAFSQGEKSYALQLHAGDPPQWEKKRPQTPQAPFPYRCEDVRLELTSDAITLAGTLTLPPPESLRGAILLVTGSGAMDRDETVFGHKPFWVLADFLSRRGYAVLRLDDRGVGESGGDRSTLTMATEAGDMAQAFAHLCQRQEFARVSIGLIGHSMGGVNVFTVAAHDPRVAFVITMGTPGVRLGAAFAEREAQGLITAGTPADVAARHAVFTEAFYQWLGENSDDNPARTEQVLELARYHGAEKTATVATNAEWLARLNTPWFRSATRIDPAALLARITVPVLAINGSLDVQAVAASNLAAIHKALTIAGNHNVETIELAGLNHLFQTATTGAVYEYPAIEETFAPLALETIAAWLDRQVGRGS